MQRTPIGQLASIHLSIQGREKGSTSTGFESGLEMDRLTACDIANCQASKGRLLEGRPKSLRVDGPSKLDRLFW